MNFHKEELIYLARIAEQGERFDEMIQFVKEFLNESPTLNSQERNLLSVSYKNSVNKRRASLRILDTVENKDPNKTANISKKSLLVKYHNQIYKELKSICLDALATVSSLIGRVTDIENHVFLIKMKADYFRYMCEYEKGEAKIENIMSAEENYLIATDLAKDIIFVNPIKLGLFLNFSVFYYEIKNQREIAINMARNAFVEGSANIDEHSNEQYYKEACMIIKLLEDNLKLWE